MSNPTQNISGINNSFDAFQTPLLTDEKSSSDPIERLSKRIVARVTQSFRRDLQDSTRSGLIDSLEQLSKELSRYLSALRPSADSSPAVADLQGQVLDALSTCNEMQKALQNAVTNKIEATANRNADLMAFTAGLYGRKDRIRAQLNKISYGKDAFQPPLSPDESSSSDPITCLDQRHEKIVTQRAIRSEQIATFNKLSIELLALSKDSALSPSADSSPSVANLRKQVLEEIDFCDKTQIVLQNAVTKKIEATPVSNQAFKMLNEELAMNIGSFQARLVAFSKNPQGTLIGKSTQKFKNFFTN